ncbi:MAG: ribonuclease HII [Bacteroidales bacterium]|nr:ribonuclease HII [Bacteroidales bacterium]
MSDLLTAFLPHCIEAGCDEAGRGCLAGPVVAAAVILPNNYSNSRFNDSKKLIESERYLLRDIIINDALAWAIGIVDNVEIDSINILNASFLAMHRAINELKIQPEHLIIDGNRFNPYKTIKHFCIVKGDSKYLSIAAASILAKTYRDDYMKEQSKIYPEYYWADNKGYPTKKHKEAIFRFGQTPLHRKTFNASIQLKLQF